MFEGALLFGPTVTKLNKSEKIGKASEAISEAEKVSKESEVISEVEKITEGVSNHLKELDINTKQLGKKWGKHKTDYPNLKSFNEYSDFCKDIFNNPEKIVFDKANNEYLYIKGNDLLRVKTNGEFVSTYPGVSSSRVTKAIEEGGTIWEQQ
ncbi:MULTISPECIES: hypothetical protein [unclassified Clostridium]|uniref:hypothetical protein n=1 Tax=unclassified Clostridium TaxID=2614128 RepID=UPI0020797D94|nr:MULTISPECIES: hypothetical protein [unclassified Clostridium]